MVPTVRRVRAGEGGLVRRLRLAALADAPHAFSSALAAEQSQPDDLWEGRAARQANGHRECCFLAFLDDVAVALVAAFRTPEATPTAELVSMWVAPEARRQGLAKRLVDTVVNWAHDGGLEAVELWVTRGNAPALEAYRRAGFIPVGGMERLPHGTCGEGQKMVRLISEGSSHG